MGDWNKPTTSSNYATNFIPELTARDFDAASLFYSAPTNPQDHMIRYNRATNKFEEYVSGVWNALVLAIASGGTGAADAAGARTNLGLGSMATQNGSAVTITGGSITGLSTFTIHCNMVPDAAISLGTNANKIDKIYIATGAVAPVGTDKYLTS